MARIEVLDESGARSRVLSLPEDSPFIVGRDEECDLSHVDSRISRRHAVLRKSDDGKYVAEDLGSKNGISINGKGSKKAKLVSGDILKIGPLILRFTEESQKNEEVFGSEKVREIIEGDSGEAARRLELLLHISTILDCLDSPSVVLEKFGTLVVQLFSPTCCYLRVLDERWGYEKDSAPQGGPQTVTVSQSVVRRISDKGEALLLHNVRDEPVAQIELGNRQETLVQKSSECYREGSQTILGIRSIIGAPILMPEGVNGILYVDQRRSGAPVFCRDDLLLLIGVGRLLSTALSNSTRFERLEAERRLSGPIGSIGQMLVGQSQKMAELRDIIENRIGPVRSSVLLIGETGTGKTVAAKAIHLASDRRRGPFIKVNCAAIPKELVESELFGHEQGAFTGAKRRKIGQFEAASGGTLFLDEVGELDLSAQSKLLSVVQDRNLTRVGGVKTIDVDVRLIAATNRDLKTEVSEGRFRADLYYRLNVVCIELPPLRDRIEDLDVLVDCFLERALFETGRKVLGISKEALELMAEYRWPGNLRELGNSIERAVIFSEPGDAIQPHHLPVEILEIEEQQSHVSVEDQDECALVTEALEQAGGNKRKAARLLGWYPQKLYARIKRYKLEPDKRG